jgi:hypothetical protein
MSHAFHNEPTFGGSIAQRARERRGLIELISEVMETEIEKLRKERTLPGEIKHPASDGITGGVRYVRRKPECGQ